MTVVFCVIQTSIAREEETGFSSQIREWVSVGREDREIGDHCDVRLQHHWGGGGPCEGFCVPRVERIQQ